MDQQKREYFLRRAAELELAANAAPTPAIAGEYRELARTFRELANDAVGANDLNSGGTDTSPGIA